MGSFNLPLMQDYIESMRSAYAEMARNTISRGERIIKRIEASYLAIPLLFGEGIALTCSKYDLDEKIWDVSVKDLPAIRRALGRLRADGTDVVEQEGKRTRANLIWVYVCPVDEQFQHLRFRFQKKLPRKKKDGAAPRCRIVTERHKAYTTRRLVCDS